VSWFQLISIMVEARETRAQFDLLGPLSCPNDGEPLTMGPDGVRYCPFDGWREGADPSKPTGL